MFKTALSLYITLFLAAGPAAAQIHEAANAGRRTLTPVTGTPGTAGGAAAANSALPVATLTGSMSAFVAPVVSLVDSAAANPASLSALAADATPAAAYARALIAAPAVSPSVRAGAVAALGEESVARLELAVRGLKSSVAADARAAKALETVSAGFAALGARDTESLSVRAGTAPSSPARLSAPRRAWRAAKTALAAASLAVTLAVTSPFALAQEVERPLPPPPPVLAQAGPVAQSQEVVRARDINDAIAQWKPGVKLIVIGDAGLDQGTLRQLNAWLADKHWTVILVQSNQGMSYRDAEGRTHYANDAVEFGAGQGLFKKEGFSGQVHEAAGLPDGSILVITMEQRKLFLRNSEAQRANGLDAEAHFNGNLDQWAKARLRAGGDIVGAVKETVTNLDSRLDSAVASAARSAASSVAEAKSSVEEYARARAAFAASHRAAAETVGREDLGALRAKVEKAEKALAAKDAASASSHAADAAARAKSALAAMSGYEANLASAKTALSSTRAEIDALEKASNAFLKDHPQAAGDLARPDLRGLREKLAAAEARISADPSAASAAATAAKAEVRRVSAALDAYAGGAARLAAAESLLESLEGRERANAASGELVSAKQALRAAQAAYADASSDWSARVAEAEGALSGAERVIAAADAKAERDARNLMIFWTLLGLFTLGAGTFLNWRARRARAKALAELAKWDAILDKKIGAIIDELDTRMDAYVGPISGEKSRGWEGETAALAAQVRSEAGRAKLYLAMARHIHGRAGALVRPARFSGGWLVNQLWPSRYALAERMLAKEPLTFKPTDGFDALFEKKTDWREDLYGAAKDYEPVTMNFEAAMEKFNALSKSAVAALSEVEAASTGYGVAFDSTQAAIDQAARAAAKAAASAYYKVEALGAKVLPAASAAIAAARAKAAKNPVGAMKGQGAEAQRLASDAAALAALALEMAAAEASAVEPAAAKLAGAGRATKWLADARAAVDAKAAAVAASVLKTPVENGLKALRAAHGEHLSAAQEAAALVAALAASREVAAEAALKTESARIKVGAALSLPAERMLRETDADPSARLAAAAEAFAEADAKLDAGILDEAAGAHARGADLVVQAEAIVAATLKSLAEQDSDVAGRQTEAARLDALVPERRTVLNSIKADFAKSVLLLSAGDASHPSANGTVEDNIDEAEAAIEAAKAKKLKAVRAFREGKLLEAASLLDQAMAHEGIAQHRLDEVAQKRARLDAAVAANAAAQEAVEGKSRAWKAEIPGDRRTMPASIKAYQEAVKALAAARGMIEAAKGDPFKAAAEIAAATAALEKAWTMTRNDRDTYGEAERSLKAARAQLDAAGRLVAEAKGDGVADSPEIRAAYDELARLDGAFVAAERALGADHGDWHAVDREADRVTAAAAQAAATLKGELAAAVKATEKISSASSKVREATNWTGSYGVSVPGTPGSGSLQSAREALNRGDYNGAVQYAERARQAAIAAIQEAEAEVSRRRRAEEERRRREEEERRARQRREEESRRRSSGGGGGGFSGGGGSSWGGSSWGGSRSGGGSSGW